MTSAPVPVAGVAPPIDRVGSIDIARVMPWLVGALVLAVAAMLVDSFPVGVVHDDGMYVILAKSIATGQGYRWLNLPGAPPATHFPPGYPAILAVLWWVYPAFPGNVLLFKLANALFTGVAAAATARFAHRRLAMSATGAAAFALVTLLGIPTLALSVIVMSEPLFLALLIPILLFAERVADAERPRLRDLVVLGVSVGAATLVRTHGIALLVAIPATLVLRRRRPVSAALFVVAAAAVVLPWQLWVQHHAGTLPEVMRGNYESYGTWLATGLRAEGASLLPRIVARTGTELLAMFATLAAPSLPGPLRIAALVVLTLLAVAGVRDFWRRSPVTALFLCFYAAIVVCWPFTPARFVWGVWPVVLMPIVLGARTLSSWRPTRRATRALRFAALASTAALAAGHAAYTLRGYRGQWWQSIPRAGEASLRPLILWAARKTAAGDLLAVEEEGAVYLYAGRRSVPVHTFTVQQYFRARTAPENAAVIREILGHYSVTAVAVTSPTMRDAVRELATTPRPLLAVRDTFPGGIVLTPSAR